MAYSYRSRTRGARWSIAIGAVVVALVLSGLTLAFQSLAMAQVSAVDQAAPIVGSASGGRTVKNNILVGGSIYEQVSHANNGDVITNNIVLTANPIQLTSSDPAVAKYVSDYNVFWNDGAAVNFPGNWKSNGLEAHSQTADPQFANGSPWTGTGITDYTVRNTSPAIGLGFTNFPMDQFGDPGSPVPPTVRL